MESGVFSISRVRPKENRMEIDKMEEADIETVMKIERKSFDSPWSKRSFMQYVRQGDAFVVRTAHNVIVGYVLIKRKGNSIVLYKMATDPEYRRKGFGRFITDWAKKFAKVQSATRLLLHARESNHQAIEFYKNTGFKFIQKIPDHFKKTGSDKKEKAAFEFQWVCS
jgi:ribosomal-protein-alanine N-acetyltransferase